MADWSAHKFVLIWLKENLNNYQFNTAEANQIKAEMLNNPLSSNEDTRQFAEQYERFLMLVERNPFTACDENGEKAAILAKDFYYYFYPTKQGLLMPIGLQIEMGATDTEAKAADLRQRLEASIANWQELRGRDNPNQAVGKDSADKSLEREFLLKHAPSTVTYVIMQIILILLSAFCLCGNVLIFLKKGLYPLSSLKSIAYWSVTVAAILTLANSIKWIVREKTRRRILDAWRRIRDIPGEGRQENKSARSIFRSAEGMTVILESIGLRSFRRDTDKDARTNAQTPDMPGIIPETLSDSKQRRMVRTARPVHIFAMLMASLCCLVYAADVLPEGPGNIVDRLSEMIGASPVIRSLRTREESADVLQNTDIQLVVKNNTWGYPGDGQGIDNNTINATYAGGTRLSMLDCCRIENGDQTELWFHERGPQGEELYVPAEDVGIEDANEIIPDTLSILDSEGNPKKTDSARYLIDGSALTAVELDKGDIIQLTFEKAKDIKAVYLMNGNLSESPKTDSGIYQADITVNDGKPRTFAYDRACDPSGYVMSVPEGGVSSLQIQAAETTSGKEKYWITELVFCG